MRFDGRNDDDDDTGRSLHSLWEGAPTRGTGFRHRVFVMYHATDMDGARGILVEDGGVLRPSRDSDAMLGAGVYASHTYRKAFNHGRFHKARDRERTDFVIFKLLVYVGRVRK